MGSTCENIDGKPMSAGKSQHMTSLSAPRCVLRAPPPPPPPPSSSASCSSPFSSSPSPSSPSYYNLSLFTLHAQQDEGCHRRATNDSFPKCALTFPVISSSTSLRCFQHPCPFCSHRPASFPRTTRPRLAIPKHESQQPNAAYRFHPSGCCSQYDHEW